MFMRDKDIDALRKGIMDQARSDVFKETWEKQMEQLDKRRYFRGDSEFVRALYIEVGDILIGTNDGYTFFEAGTVEKITRETHNEKEYLYFTISEPGNNRRRFDLNETVLRKFRYQRQDGSS
jgi:hypothetical protein